jgi:hypothetical protein
LKNVKNQSAHFNASEMSISRSDRKKLFSKTSQSAPSHSSNLPPRRNVGLQAMPFMGSRVADYSQRSSQHKRNAELSGVSLRPDGSEQNVNATQEALSHLGVAPLRIFSGRVTGNIFG